jgi:hypothetical protein
MGRERVLPDDQSPLIKQHVSVPNRREPVDACTTRAVAWLVMAHGAMTAARAIPAVQKMPPVGEGGMGWAPCVLVVNEERVAECPWHSAARVTELL